MKPTPSSPERRPVALTLALLVAAATVTLAAAWALRSEACDRDAEPSGFAHGTADVDGVEFQYGLFDPSSDTWSGTFHQGVGKLRQRHARGDGMLLWFSLDGREYVTRDAAVLRAAKNILEPMQELGARMGRLGSKQGDLGSQQAAIGARQARIGARQAMLSARITRSALRSASSDGGRSDRDGELEREMEELGRAQEELALQQEPLARAQEDLGRRQEELGRQMERLSKRAGREMKRLAESALDEGKAFEAR
jgi:hypothetical protein